MTTIDKKTQTPMMQQYLTIKDQYPDMLVFFRLGDFYEMFFDDAIKTSKLLEITLTSRGGANDKIPMCGVPYHAAHTYIQKLIDMGEKIAIAEQTSEPTKGKTLVEREVTKIITPGTFVQEGMFEADTQCYIASICYQDNQHTISYGDISIGKYYYMSHLKTLEQVADALRMIQPLEVIVSQKQLVTYEPIEAYSGHSITALAAVDKTQRPGIDDAAIASFSVLESYLLSVRSDSMLSFQGLYRYIETESLYMSAATISSLELFETIKTRAKQGSLLTLLDRTQTALGSRLLKIWLSMPLTDAVTISERLDIVENFIAHYLDRVQVQKMLTKMYDVERLISRIAAHTAGVRELHQLKITMQTMDELQVLLSHEHIHSEIKKRLIALKDITTIYQLLDTALATEDITSVNDTGIFRSGYNEQLDELLLLTQGGSQWLLDLEQKEKTRTGIKNLRIKYNKVFGFFIEISKGNAELVQEEWGYQRKQTLTNAERFVTEELKAKEEQILGAQEKLAQLERQLFLALCDQVIPYRSSLQQTADFIAWIDVLQSFADVSQEYGYHRPVMGTKEQMFLKQSRHPIIEQVVKEHFIANDVLMQNDDVLIITGPNMAGKSTYMRQIALCAIMHQIGCFVPALEAVLPIFDAIYTRIGAQDDLFSGESTFMVEMKEVSLALEKATAHSLIIFDEIGRGTATYDGLALAYAIFTYIHETIHAKTLFSTHYHEFTEFTAGMDKVRNIHVSATLSGDDIIFHHHVKDGHVERSYGVQVAKLAHLPTSVLQQAKELLIVLEAQKPMISPHVLNSDYMESILHLQQQVESLQSEKATLEIFQEQVIELDLDELSPKQAYQCIEQLQAQAQRQLDEKSAIK